MTGKSSTPRIGLKRVYETAREDDGLRLLVERLWPRGLTKEAAAIDRWFKSIAPSPELRRWYNHVPERWPEFRERYERELAAADAVEIAELVAICETHSVTFVFAARDEARNSAVVLRELILGRMSDQ